MTQKDKDLLLKDLCARLPYGVKCHFKYGSAEDDVTLGCIDNNVARFEYGFYGRFHVSIDANYIKPYLRPMSSMTEEEKAELLLLIVRDKKDTKYFQVMPDGSIEGLDESTQELYNFSFHWINFDGINTSSYIDWLNAHHFDYRGLIPMNLALEAPKGMYK